MDTEGVVRAKYRALAGRLDEATLRLWAAAEARGLGRGGVSAVIHNRHCVGPARAPRALRLWKLELQSLADAK
jgi:hypothetical protein